MPADVLGDESRSDILQDLRLDKVEEKVAKIEEVSVKLGENIIELKTSVEVTNNLLGDFKDLMVKLAGSIMAVVAAAAGVGTVI